MVSKFLLLRYGLFSILSASFGSVEFNLNAISFFLLLAHFPLHLGLDVTFAVAFGLVWGVSILADNPKPKYRDRCKLIR